MEAGIWNTHLSLNKEAKIHSKLLKGGNGRTWLELCPQGARQPSCNIPVSSYSARKGKSGSLCPGLPFQTFSHPAVLLHSTLRKLILQRPYLSSEPSTGLKQSLDEASLSQQIPKNIIRGRISHVPKCILALPTNKTITQQTPVFL